MHPSTLRTPAEIERHWFEHVYQGDRQRQLTVRAAVMGMLLGMVMSVSNLYLGLKSGTGIGGAITTLRRRANAQRKIAADGTVAAGDKYPGVSIKSPEAACSAILAADWDEVADDLEQEARS